MSLANYGICLIFCALIEEVLDVTEDKPSFLDILNTQLVTPKYSVLSKAEQTLGIFSFILSSVNVPTIRSRITCASFQRSLD